MLNAYCTSGFVLEVRLGQGCKHIMLLTMQNLKVLLVSVRFWMLTTRTATCRDYRWRLKKCHSRGCSFGPRCRNGRWATLHMQIPLCIST